LIRTGTREDLTRIVELVRRANDAPYELERVLEEKLFTDGVDGAPEVRLSEDGPHLVGMSVVCGKYLRLVAVDRQHRRRGVGSRLIADARVFGAEPGNYFTPGIVDTDAATIAFARAMGFRETAATWNLTVDVGQAFSSWGRLKPAPTFVPPDDPEFLSFVEREFGRIWRFEAARAETAIWIEGIGFAVQEANNRGLGTFGPTGVAKEHRGKGYGREILMASLEDLRRRGYSRATIPWTDALDFYRKSCGAEPAHRFVAFAK
jgi:GNAT superfamily N-acetyltransferase